MTPKRFPSLRSVALALCVVLVGICASTQGRASCSDSVVVRTVQRFSTASTGNPGSTHVVACTLNVLSGRRYLIEMLRPTGGPSADSVKVTYGGTEYFGRDDLGSPGTLESRVIAAQHIANLQVQVAGTTGFGVDIRITQVPEPLYQVFTRTFTRGITYAWISSSFSPLDGIPPGPHVAYIYNGNGDVSKRAFDCEVELNSSSVVGSGELNLGTAILRRGITLDENNTLRARLENASGKQIKVVLMATDDTAPELTVSAPPETLFTTASKVDWTASVVEPETGVLLTLNGSVKGQGTSGFSDSLALTSDGRTTMAFKAENGACLNQTSNRVVIRDTQAPTLQVLSPLNFSEVTASTANESVWFTIRVADSTRTTVRVNGDSVGVLPLGRGVDTLMVLVPMDLGPNGVHFRATDFLGHVTEFKRYVNRIPTEATSPPDSGAVRSAAPDLQLALSTDFRGQITFLLDSLRQVGLSSTAVLPGRESVIRGRVIARDFGPVPNVAVRALNHPEYGVVLTANNGTFEFVATGGTQLVLMFVKDGYLDAHRQIDAPLQDYLTLDDVAMLGRSSRSYPVNLTTGGTVVGRFENDANGDRDPTFFFTPGTQCTVVTAGGTRTALTSFNMRIKEYTVGGDGDVAMPASLPAGSAYTYCLNLTVDEALALRGTGEPEPEVLFNPPVHGYVRDFLDLPVGTGVPAARYEPATGRWVSFEDGLVVSVLAETSGVAILDTNGDGIGDGSARLDSLSLDLAERGNVATRFAPGDTLWRMTLDHFSEPDFNLSNAQLAARVWAALLRLLSLLTECPTPSTGCVIETENRVLGETIPVQGTPFALHYRSSRQPGDRVNRTVSIPLTPANLPAEVKKVYLVVEVAGRRFNYSYTPSANLTVDFVDWDGTDIFDREVRGTVTATIRVGYDYQQKYMIGAATTGRSWASGSSSGSALARGDRDVGRTQWVSQVITLGTPSTASAGLGGWTITPHHFYDTNGQGTLLLGDGARVTGDQQNAVTKRFAGTGSVGLAGSSFDTTGVSATTVTAIPVDMAFGPNGNLYVTMSGTGNPHVVAQITPTGNYTVLAGRNATSETPPGDGVHARSLYLKNPSGIALGPDGSVYFSDLVWKQVYRIAPDGLLWHFAGKVTGGATVEDGLAKDAALVDPKSIAVGPDGSVFIGEGNRIMRVGPDGRIRRFAGTGTGGTLPSNPTTVAQAKSVTIDGTEDMVCDAAGNLYFTEGSTTSRVRRVAPDGLMYTHFQASNLYPSSLAVGSDGIVYMSQNHPSLKGVYRREADSTATLVASGLYPHADVTGQDGQYARAATFGSVRSIACGPDGALYIGEYANAGNANGIHRVAAELPGRSSDEIVYPSSDGREIYYFTLRGQHLRTEDAVTGVVLYRFGYDTNQQLIRIIDADGDTTLIDRSGPLTIRASYGQVTTLSLSGDYLTGVTNANSESYAFDNEDGLVKHFRDPRGRLWTYEYSGDGRLEEDTDPDGGGWTLDPGHSGVHYSVDRISKESRTTRFEVDRLSDGTTRRRIIEPDGARVFWSDSMSVDEPFGRVVVSGGAAGDSSVTRLARDSRFGWLAPLATTSVSRLPSGLKNSQHVTRSHTSTLHEETLTLAGQTYISNYAIPSKTLTLTSPEGRVSTTTLDAAGRPLVTSVSGMTSITRTYGDRGLLQSIVQGPRRVDLDFDSSGRVLRLRSPYGRAVTFAYDNSDRITSRVLPGGRTVAYGYDAAGDLTRITPPGRGVHTFGLSGTGLDSIYTPPTISGVSDPSTRIFYDAEHRVERIERPDSVALEFSYSGTGGRLASLTEPRGNTSFSYRTASVHGASRATGQVATVTSPDTVTLTFGYDGPMVTSQEWSGKISGTVATELDSFFRVAVERVNGAYAVTYGYDDDGLVTSATPSGGTALTIARRSSDGRVQSLTAGVVVTTNTYDARGALTDIEHAISGSPYLSHHIVRDSSGRIVEIDETRGGTTVARFYGHDGAGRLSTVMEGDTLRRTYEYDSLGVGNGNRTRTLSPGGALVAASSPDAQDRLVSHGDSVYTYNAAGELIRRVIGGSDTTRYAYDLQGNLLLVSRGASSVRYRVDGAGRRVGRLVNGLRERSWLWSDGTRLAAELDASDAVITRYVYASRGHVADLVLRGGAEYRVLTDHLGSVRALVNVSTGSVAQTISYDAWGARMEDTAPGWQSLGYAGGLSDTATKFVRFGARDYDPVVGRWTSKDPIGFAGGDPNLYAYVGNLPLDAIDPAGTISSDDLEMKADNPPRTLGPLPAVEELMAKRLKVQSYGDKLRDEYGQDPNHVNRWEHAVYAKWLSCKYGYLPTLVLMTVKEWQDMGHKQKWHDFYFDLQSNLEGLDGEIPVLPLRPTPFDRGKGGRSRP